MSASEQGWIEMCAPDYLRNIILIMAETGLWPCKQLRPMRKEQVDLTNGSVHLPDSKTSSGIADMPMTAKTHEALGPQMPVLTALQAVSGGRTDLSGSVAAQSYLFADISIRRNTQRPSSNFNSHALAAIPEAARIRVSALW